jgi:hypothetical protein
MVNSSNLVTACRPSMGGFYLAGNKTKKRNNPIKFGFLRPVNTPSQLFQLEKDVYNKDFM